VAKAPSRAKSRARAKAGPSRRPAAKSKSRKSVRPRAAKRAGTHSSIEALRRDIDALDAKLVPLLCRRLQLVASAARFKPSIAGVIVPARVEEIIAGVRGLAMDLGSNPDCIETVYRHLIDVFTREEQRRWRMLHDAGD
jgi:isochorismate pyruvate lyase